MTKLTNKNITKNQSRLTAKMRTISLATLIVASVFASTTIIYSQNAYAITCPLNGWNLPRCYAQHNFSQGTTGAYNGMQSTQKVLYHTISSGTWLQSSNWAIHPSGDFVELGWHQNGGSGTTPFFVCGVNGGATAFGPTPSDNTYYVLKSEDLNLDKTWVLSLNTGHSCNKASTSSSAFLLQVGYETPDGNGLTFETNDYTGLQFARAPNTWAFWNSADGTNGKTLRPNDGTYFVTFCGGAAEQFWHSKHGQGTPVSC